MIDLRSRRFYQLVSRRFSSLVLRLRRDSPSFLGHIVLDLLEEERHRLLRVELRVLTLVVGALRGLALIHLVGRLLILRQNLRQVLLQQELVHLGFKGPLLVLGKKQISVGLFRQLALVASMLCRLVDSDVLSHS